MNEKFQDAKNRYRSADIPPELDFAVASALREGERRRRQRRWQSRTLASLAACCASFVLLVNASPAFASAVYQVPVLGDLARVVTVTEYSIADGERLIDVRLPAVEDTGHSDLEQRINTEIQTRIDAVLAEAQARAEETKEAFVATGGDPDEFMPVIIDVDYEVKCRNDQYLSFVIFKTETKASAYTEFFCYNIDLETGTDLTLQDMLGPNYKEIANQVIREEIARRSQDPDNVYFDGTDGIQGFQSIAADQPFYINEAGNPVVVFEKYEIAPGYMGQQEFEIPVPQA
ncbi:DUF3298 and DUF4163 domain-containing protein [uncultured Pseudoflavonifractor sp.]|uniref:DUF3298 and DUF4163 domain-containing protein n=1 Tax=uncultured Pseudoflavonifractor sp. TaxID=1221379 RepID=UPI0025DB6829|nr:DUF3298 and DUF4163 domain-containing protein [uncultured Pseudoflavonifractor sp.]